MRVILNKGASSTVFTDDAEPGVVIKQPNDLKNVADYFNSQAHGYAIIDTIKAYSTDVGVLLPELVEIINTESEHVIKEKVIPGKTFRPEIYDALSQNAKISVAKQMATFLNVMHSSSEYKPATESTKRIFNDKSNNADDIIAKFGGYLPKSVADKLKATEKYLKETDISDEVVVMTHKDLRTSNIIYDKNTGKIAVIDFELAGLDNVYHDFIAFAPASSMPWDFTKRVIDFYNKIPNKKYPITINPEKVQNMLFYGILQELARCIDPENNRYATKEGIVLLYKKLEVIAGITFDTKNVFQKAIQKIKNAGNYTNLLRKNGEFSKL